jgi:hypothetical protein
MRPASRLYGSNKVVDVPRLAFSVISQISIALLSCVVQLVDAKEAFDRPGMRSTSTIRYVKFSPPENLPPKKVSNIAIIPWHFRNKHLKYHTAAPTEANFGQEFA